MIVASIKIEIIMVYISKILIPVINIFLPLKYVLYIYYMVHFKKDQIKAQTLINSNNKVNTITKLYVIKLDLSIHTIDIKAQKIDNFSLKMFSIILASFEIKKKLERV